VVGPWRARFLLLVFFRKAKVPLEEQVLALGVTNDALPIPAKLGVVGRQQLESSEHPGSEFLDQRPIAEVGMHLPVRRNGTEVHDPDVAPWRLVDVRFFCADRHEPCTVSRRDRDSLCGIPSLDAGLRSVGVSSVAGRDRSKHENFPGCRSVEQSGTEASMETEWMAGGLCRDIAPSTFFPSDGVGVEVARRICADCPVRQACLEYALANRIDHGVWGGCSERERRRILKRRRISVN
jgi:WhiB family redox-sensing transcriptional regulator